MSIKAMSWIWDNSKQKGAKLLVLLAIADRCDDEGTCFPGHARLATKSRTTKQTVSKHIKALEGDDELSVTVHGGIKTTHGNTNRYYLKKYRDSLGLETPTGNRSEYVTYDGVSKRIPQGVSDSIPDGVSDSIPYSSVYPSGNTSDSLSLRDNTAYIGNADDPTDKQTRYKINCPHCSRVVYAGDNCKQDNCPHCGELVVIDGNNNICSCGDSACDGNCPSCTMFCTDCGGYKLFSHGTAQKFCDDCMEDDNGGYPPDWRCNVCEKPYSSKMPEGGEHMCGWCFNGLTDTRDDIAHSCPNFKDGACTLYQDNDMACLDCEFQDRLIGDDEPEAKRCDSQQTLTKADVNKGDSVRLDTGSIGTIVDRRKNDATIEFPNGYNARYKYDEFTHAENPVHVGAIIDNSPLTPDEIEHGHALAEEYGLEDDHVEIEPKAVHNAKVKIRDCQKATPQRPIGDDLETDLIIEPVPKAKKPRKRAKKEQSPEEIQAKQNMEEAVRFAWELAPKGAAWKMKKIVSFLTGKVYSNMTKRYGQAYFDCQLKANEEDGIYPATAQEVVAFGHWYRRTYSGATLPEKATTLLDKIMTFRAHQDYNAFLHKAQTTIRERLTGIVIAGITPEPEQEAEEKMPVTPELKAEIEAALDIF